MTEPAVGRCRVAVIHGLGGTAATMAPVTEALRAAGHSVVAPTLPGHGSAPDDLVATGWQQWLEAVPEADVIVGQSMGANLALARAAMDPTVSAVVAINPLAADPDAIDALDWMTERGRTWIDVAPSTVGEAAYERLPVASLLSMHHGIARVDLLAVRCAVHVVTSALDDVVDPANSIAVMTAVAGPVEQLVLDHSGHVATLDRQAADLVHCVLDVCAAIAAR